MSKSKGNVIDPLDVINDGYGADTLRTYEMFIGPYDQDAAWDTRSVGGVYRFLNRCWTLAFATELSKEDKNVSVRNRTIKKVTEDIHRYNFNTAVAALMEYVNELYKVGATTEDLIVLAKLLKPFAPHLASEMLEKLSSDDEWPKWESQYLTSDTAEIIIQVNGKLRSKITIDASDLADEEKVIAIALADDKIKKYTESGVKKTIFVPKAKILNIVV